MQRRTTFKDVNGNPVPVDLPVRVKAPPAPPPTVTGPLPPPVKALLAPPPTVTGPLPPPVKAPPPPTGMQETFTVSKNETKRK